MPHSADPRVRGYLEAIVAAAAAERLPLCAVILFGSAVTGGYERGVSDLDLVLVVSDAARDAERRRIRAVVEALEAEHGLSTGAEPRGLDGFLRRATANRRSFFVCARGDVLSGDPARLFGIPRTQAVFVDRAVVPSIVASAMTVWGEDLLPRVPLPPIRRLDVLKAFFSAWNQMVLIAALHPFVPDATRYALAVVKRAVHNCSFCLRLAAAPLAAEVHDMKQRVRGERTLDELLALRADYRRSGAFVLRAFPLLVRMYVVTALTGGFPKHVPRPTGPRAAPAVRG